LLDLLDPFSPAQIAHVSRRVTLPDGRGLGIAEFGPADGPPILYFHGWPSSRLEPAILGIDNVRLIGVDRPGYGLSDAVKPGPRRLADWPKDIAALADKLGLQRFAVFGLSGGAPYAAAVAAAMPERVAGLALVSGLGPPEAPGMQAGRMAMLLGFGTAHWRRRIVFNLARRTLISERNDARILSMRRRYVHRGERDSMAMTDELGERLLACWREGLRRGVEGAASDCRIYGEPWPFRAAEIRVPTTIWHGEADHVVPVSIGRFYAAALPKARQHFIPGEGHISLAAFHYDDILDELLACF
jgi:pimeloyl-ACP methyl ester carboxylesterase